MHAVHHGRQRYQRGVSHSRSVGCINPKIAFDIDAQWAAIEVFEPDRKMVLDVKLTPRNFKHRDH